MPSNNRSAEGQGVMVVDDEPSIRELADVALTMHGFRVFLASNGDEAVDILNQNPGGIEVAIIDLNMPGKSGVEVTKDLLEIKPQLRVIVSTGSDIADLDIDIKGIGAKGYIEKPYRISDMHAKILEVME